MKGKAFMAHWPLIREVLQDHLDRGEVKYTAHADKRMRERGISKTAVEAVLVQFAPTEMHEPLAYPFGEQPHANPDPVLTVTGMHDGKRIAIALAVKKRKHGLVFSVITVMRAEGGRHQ